jgi:polypeptide N-acetylgalactosaminyltransferase
MYNVPCSHFGHMFRRDGRPLKNPKPYHYIRCNYKRVVEVWMDEYKEYIYMRSPETYDLVDVGDLTRQKAVRERLKCKSFKWFLETVAVEVLPKFPVLGEAWFARGAVSHYKIEFSSLTIPCFTSF